MKEKAPRDRAREIIEQTRTRAEKVGKMVRDRVREAGGKDTLEEIRTRMRRRAIRAAGWIEKRAGDLRVKLGDPVPQAARKPAPVDEPPVAEPHAVEVAVAPPEAAPAEGPKKKRATRPRKPRAKKSDGAAPTERKKTTRRKAPARAKKRKEGEEATQARAQAAATPSMDLREIGRDVYACLQEDRGLGTSNSGLVNRGGGLVIDTFWDLPHTRRLIEQYASVWKEPARRVVNTHHNGDHCWGNQLFPDAEIIGHRLCAEALAHESPEMMQALRDSVGSGDPVVDEFAAALRDWDFSGIELRPPTTLVEDRLEIDLDGVPVHLIYAGPAHTAGDLIVHLPEQRVVFAGDILFRLCTPIGWEGTYDRWMEALENIVALEPEVIVPGHGPLCGVEGPREMRDYLAYVRSEARRFFDEGVPALEAARRIDLGPYAGWTEPQRLIFNVERAYREFRGEPFDAPVDLPSMIRGMHELRQSWTP